MNDRVYAVKGFADWIDLVEKFNNIRFVRLTKIEADGTQAAHSVNDRFQAAFFCADVQIDCIDMRILIHRIVQHGRRSAIKRPGDLKCNFCIKIVLDPHFSPPRNLAADPPRLL